MYKIFFKLILDKLLSIIILICLSPLFLIIILLLFFFNKKNVFFVQKRPGKNEKIFNLIKFKTMTDETDINGKLLPDKQRLTKIGNFIRSTSIDEIPQILNVLKGDMSFIGPRPLLVRYLPLYDETQKRRHNIKPGITGWAQINGRNAISWEEKFKFDVWYVENFSFLLDIKIFWLTFVKVFKRDGINLSTENTALPFQGKNLNKE
jgi:lipopolysaccharide/colanic/teichoic acid biosynthesis glycosyltransferase